MTILGVGKGLQKLPYLTKTFYKKKELFQKTGKVPFLPSPSREKEILFHCIQC